jgi:hypothetical protein
VTIKADDGSWIQRVVEWNTGEGEDGRGRRLAVEIRIEDKQRKNDWRG